MRNGVGWANVLSRVDMVATYGGKVIGVPSSQGGSPNVIFRTQTYVDEIIAAEQTWSEIYNGNPGGPPLNVLVYDDGTPVTEWVPLNDVPGDALSSIVLDPAFYIP